MTAIYSQNRTVSHQQQQQHPSKMSATVRRTVSSAAHSGGSRSSLGPVSTKAQLSNTQSSNGRLPKEPHKKLDRSFSEPAEKKNSSLSAIGPSSRYKTELCRSFAEVGMCKYGDKCQFAHGDEELRTITRHPKFKTENCKSFHSTGFCPYGPRCHFIHNNDESKKSILTNLQGCAVSNSTPSVPVSQVTTSAIATGFSPLVQPSARFVSTSPTAVLNNVSLVRPKALSLGSYSLGSSGEMSSPSSQSGSPTSLNSFFIDDVCAFGMGPGFVGSNTKLSSAAVGPTFTQATTTTTSAFTFSSDSAFVSFTPTNSNHRATTNLCAEQSSFFVGSCQPPEPSPGYSPEPSISETTNSVLSSILDGSPSNSPLSERNDTFMFRDMSPVAKSSHILVYPSSPESPVDSVASEIEALKLGEQPPSFSSTSSSFSTSSSMSTSSVSPPNVGIPDHLAMGPFGMLPNIPRLPTFTKFATPCNDNDNSTGSASSIELSD